jgi:hypothetical protein
MSRICHVNIRKRDGLMTIARVDEHTIVVHGNTFSLPQKHVISISRSSSASIPRLGHRGREFVVESPMGSGEDNPGGGARHLRWHPYDPAAAPLHHPVGPRPRRRVHSLG